METRFHSLTSAVDVEREIDAKTFVDITTFLTTKIGGFAATK